MKSVGILPIYRKNAAKTIEVYKQAEDRVKNNKEFFVLSPEGGRRTVPELGPFKKGPFIFALNVHAPVIPVVLKGIWEFYPKGQFIPGTKNNLPLS